MKKPSRVSLVVALGLAGFIGQLTAAGAATNSLWNLSAISAFKAGSISKVLTNPVTAVFLSDGTASLQFGGHEYAGTYTNTDKLLTFTLGEVGKTELKADAAALIQPYVPGGVTITVSSVKFGAKIKLSTNGVPVVAKDAIKGKGCLSTKCKGFKLTTLWSNWVLASGTNF